MRKKHHRPSALGRLLSHIPQDKKWLFPFYEAGQLFLTREVFYSSALPAEWDGFTIAYCSDIHFGPMLSTHRATGLMEKMNTLEADIMLLGGDYGETAHLGAQFARAIPRPLARHGVLAAIGNHDLKGSSEECTALIGALIRKGIRPLQNAAFTLNGRQSDLIFCATDDVKFGSPNISILFETRDRPAFVVFFPHSPDILPTVFAHKKKAFDLALCGHTHGGQITLWGHSLHSSSKFGDRFRTGWISENAHNIFVSNGVGTSLMPLRLGAPPQYHLITLKRC